MDILQADILTFESITEEQFDINTASDAVDNGVQQKPQVGY